MIAGVDRTDEAPEQRAFSQPVRAEQPLGVPTIIVTGPVGAGKTTVAQEMGLILLDAKVPHANVDFDQLTACYPRPVDDDRWATNLGLRNLAALWRNYQASGARRLLIARVIESRAELDGFRQAVPGADIVVVRLRAAPETLHTRVRQRRQGRMEWHLDGAVELAHRTPPTVTPCPTTSPWSLRCAPTAMTP